MWPYDNMTPCDMSSIQRNALWHVMSQLYALADQCLATSSHSNWKFHPSMTLSGQLNSSFASDQHPETYFQGNSLPLSITLCGPIPLPTCPRCPAFIPNPSHPKQRWWPRLHSSSTSYSSHSVFNPLQTKPALAPPPPPRLPHTHPTWRAALTS